MDIITIAPLTALSLADLQRLVVGYTSPARYRVQKTESETEIHIALVLEPLPEPYIKRWPLPDEELLALYQELPAQGFSFGAYADGGLVGLALAEPRGWNRSLWVWEFHVLAAYQGQGLGRRLMEAVTQKAAAASLRAIVCETQSTNAPAIAAYRKLGFALEGLDLSYYSNEDYPDGEMALFMKKRIE